ncbi:hypothetical protein ATL42_1787 [Sanguibacter antarcticus]|uniref:Uncharacterized protein n=1 Tax=Sanguibacter antarcticus TaxID=372484 RepID=A0A2A9E4X0_9MICO|nr:hypothetical protein ATL42_1787 [Sanguibacter antarcticus]
MVVDRFGAFRRTLEQRFPSDSSSGSVPGAPSSWVSGALSGVQAFLFSLAVMLVPAVAIAVAGAAQAGDQPTPWGGALGTASGVWLLAHGVPFVTGPATLTLVPLGLSAVAVFGAFASARRTMRSTWPALVAGVLAYTVGVCFVALVAGAGEVSQVVAALGGGLLVGALGLGAGVLTRPDAGHLRRSSAALIGRLPLSLSVGLRGAFVAAALLVLTSSLLVLVWVLSGRSASRDVVAALGLDGLSGVSLAVAQLALVPDLVVWALTWLAGPGFAVGTGTHFGIEGVTSGPLPALPLLGALPGPSAGGGPGAWAPVVVVVVGVVAGLVVHRALERIAWWHVLVLAPVCGLGAGVLSGALVAFASGAAGPGRLQDVGASGTFVGLCVAALVALGCLLVLVAVRPEVHGALRRLVARRPGGAGAAADGSSAPTP